MRKVTIVSSGRGRSKQTKLYLDGESTFSLDRVGPEELPPEQSEPAESERLRECFNAAVRYLGYRARSEREVRQRLQRGDFVSKDIEAVLVELKKKGLIDDQEFAQSWINDRSSFKPRSKRLIKLELKQKGIAAEIIDQVTGAMSDFDSARQAAMAKARTLSRSDYESFYSRLSEYLKRRGFDYRVIKEVVEQTWQELGESEHTSPGRGAPCVKV